MRISDWSSDVCSSDLNFFFACQPCEFIRLERIVPGLPGIFDQQRFLLPVIAKENVNVEIIELHTYSRRNWRPGTRRCCKTARSEEHTSDLQSLMRISYAVFCLNKQKQTKH